MITLAIDTSYRYLTIGLYQDERLLAGSSEECFKRQSEQLFVQLNRLLEEAGLGYKDIGQVVITEGPGSYTGVRIAMSAAKVLCSQLHIPLYTINTMQLYTGLDSGVILLDARAKRAYFARIKKGRIVDLKVEPIEELKKEIQKEDRLFGDHLIEEDALQVVSPSDFLSNFMALKPLWKKVEHIHALKPLYLKENEAYRPKLNREKREERKSAHKEKERD